MRLSALTPLSSEAMIIGMHLVRISKSAAALVLLSLLMIVTLVACDELGLSTATPSPTVIPTEEPTPPPGEAASAPDATTTPDPAQSPSPEPTASPVPYR